MLKIATSLVRLIAQKSTFFTLALIQAKQTKNFLLAAILLALLSSCSSKQETISVTSGTQVEEVVIDSGTLSATKHLELAKAVDADLAITKLLTATKLFYQEKNYLNALWLAEQTLPLIDINTPKSTQEKVHLSLIKASSLQKLGYFAESRIQLNQLEEFAKEQRIPLNATYYRLVQTAFQQEKQLIPALNAQLIAFSLTPESAQNTEQIEQIWQRFQSLYQWQLKLLTLDNPPGSKGWLALTAVANKFGANQVQMQYHLRIWQKKFKLHPANVIAKQLAAKKIMPKEIENIAVIIPLSGKQNAAGLAIQQGILASFSNDKTKKLHFIDSNTVNWYGLTNDFSILKIDYVIGPLLKSNVDKYIKHTNPHNQSPNNYIINDNSNLFGSNSADSQIGTPAIDSQSAISSYLTPTNTAMTFDTLLLNIPSKAILTNQHTVLSMRPEDEARQAAATLSRQKFQHPIVLSQDNVVSKRIAQAFVTQWQLLTGGVVDIVYYETGAEMQDNIKKSLAVDKSQDRINSLKRKLNNNIKTQTRNRRDIDMVYLVGTPKQTRLVKPFIEVNISPFADTIPIYASSRSHSTQSDDSTSSDLQGLTFTEIPWLLQGEQDPSLAALSQKLWPKRNDGLLRLFAMGFDSYQLVSKIDVMKQAPYLQHWGQTGVLMLGDNNILTRSLLWGKYKRNKVESIVME